MGDLTFEGFEIDRDGSRVLRAGAEVALEPRALELLCYLAQNPGRLIGKDELLERVWNAHALSEGVLPNTIAKLRRALGQHASARTPIETVHGRGYRFRAARAAPATVTEPFVGRHAVSRLLDDALGRAAAGTGSLVLITGEAGIGKSRTLRELLERARARGLRTWCGAAYAGGGAPAYWPWIDALRGALADPGVRGSLPKDSWAIASLVPEHLDATPPMAANADSTELRFRLFDELRRWLGAACSDAPIVIALEDVHWADVASVKLLGDLARRLGQLRVLLAATWREPEKSREPEQVVHGSLLRDAQHVRLHGLAQAEVAELSRMLGHPVPDVRTAELLYARTQGNPFFLRQVLQLLQQRGQPLTAASLLASEWPAVVRETIDQRLAGLSEETRTALAAASAIGQKFSAELLACLLGWPLTAALSALEPALCLGLVRELGGHSADFELVHALVGEALYESLGLVERGALHASAARLIERRAAATHHDPHLLGEVARHSLLAVPFVLDACMSACRRAAAAARAVYGFEAAAELLQRALDKLGGEAQPALQLELRFQCALDLCGAGQLDAARRMLQEGAQLARAQGAADWLARFVACECGWWDLGGQTNDLVAALDDALTRLDPAQRGLRAILLARQAEVGGKLSNAQRDALFEAAQKLADESGDTSVMLDVVSARAHTRNPARVEDCRRALDHFRSLSAHVSQRDLAHQLRQTEIEVSEYWCALLQGNLVLADLATAQLEATAAASGSPHLQMAVAMMRSMRALGDGRLDDMQRYVERMRSCSSGLGGSSEVGWMYAHLLLAEARSDARVLAQLAAAVDLSMLTRLTPEQRFGGIASRARLAARLGQPQVAHSLLARIPREELARLPARYGDLGILCSLTEAYWQLEDAEPARQLYAQLSPYAALNAVGVAFEYKGSVSEYLGMLALLLGERANALAHLRCALAFNERLRMPLQVARTRALLERAAG